MVRVGNVLKAALAGNRIIALVVILIAAATLRPGGGGSGGSGCLICGERGLADFISNVILFTPLGAAIALRRRTFWYAVLFGGLLSLSIEVLQWRLIAGRDSNLGDLVANTMGTVVGWSVVRLWPWGVLGRGATIRAYALALFTLLCLLGALKLLTPAFSRSAYYLHWIPAYESLAQYSGSVLSTELDLMEWRQGSHTRMEPVDSIGKLLRRTPVRIRFIAGPAPLGLAPIMSISDHHQDEVVMIGVDGNDLIYRFRSQADDARFDDGNLRVPDVFRGLQRGDTADVSLMFTTARYCVRVNARTVCGRGFSIGDSWSLLRDPHWRPAAYGAFGVFFLWLAFLPTGLITPTTRSLLPIGCVVGVVMAVGPKALEFCGTPWYQAVAAIFGLYSGHVIGTRLARSYQQAGAHSGRRLSNN